RDALELRLLADHESRDVLEEDQWNVSLAAELDEVRPLQRALREEHAVVRQDTDRITHPTREPAHQSRPVPRLELVESAPIDKPRYHLAYVERLPEIARNDPVDLRRSIQRLLRRREIGW